MRTATMLLATAGVVTALVAAGAGQDKGSGDSELVAREKFIKAQFVRLTDKMLEVARLLEKSEPETAKALRDAVDQSKRAFVAEDMDKVAEFLSKGLATAAATTKQEVIKELQNILETLRYGTIDLDKRWQRIKEWQKYLARVNKALEKEKNLERQSRVRGQADQIDREMKRISAELAEIIARQKKVLAETHKLKAANPGLQKLSDLRRKVRELIEEQDRVTAASSGAPVDKLPLVGKAQKSLAAQTEKVQRQLAEATSDPSISNTLKKAEVAKGAMSAAGKKLAQAAGEMGKATKALDRSDAKAAQGPQEQAGIDLRAAEKQLSRILEKCAQGSPAGRLAGQQGDLAKETQELSKAAESLAQRAGAEAKAASMAKASGHMSKAAQKLSAQNAGGAAREQKEALKQLEERQKQLAQLHRRMLEESRRPLDKQKQEQGDLASQTGKLGQQMKQSSSGSAPGQASVASASKSMSQACGKLGQNDSKSANESQNKAMEELRRAAQELARAIDREREMAQAEQLAKLDAMLERILKTQRAVSAGTREVWGKRAGDGYERPEQLRLSELSDGEGRLAEDVKSVRKMLLKEGTTAVFPAVLEEVRVDLAGVQKRLADMDPGTVTQTVQREIERSLEQMLEALRRERSRRRQAGGMAGGAGMAGGGGGGKQPLVPPAAELKMLKLLEMQVKERTVVLARQKEASGTNEALTEQHKLLAARQEKIKKMAVDMKKKLGLKTKRPARKGL